MKDKKKNHMKQRGKEISMEKERNLGRI